MYKLPTEILWPIIGQIFCGQHRCKRKTFPWQQHVLVTLKKLLHKIADKKSKLHSAGFQSPGKTGIFSQVRSFYEFQPEDSMCKSVLKYGNSNLRTISCINQHYSLALKLSLLHCFGMIAFETLALFSWLHLNIILSIILSVLAVSPVWLLSFWVHFLLWLFCLPLIYTVTSPPPPMLNTALQCFSAHPLHFEATFHSHLQAFNIQKWKKGDQNKRSLLLLWSKLFATLYWYSPAPMTKMASLWAISDMSSQHM